MKIFLINLDDCTERLESARRQLTALGLSYERCPAVDGRALSPEKRKKMVSRFRWWCAIGRKVRPGEIGCAYSHYYIYRKMIAEQIPFVCILEDDVELGNAFPEHLHQVEEFLDPSKPQVVLFSNHSSEQSSKNEIREAKSDTFAEGYALTVTAARKLLAANVPMRVPCDHWGRWRKRKIIELYHSFPATCCQRNFPSRVILGKKVPRTNDLPIPLFLIYKLKRLIGVTVDQMLWLLSRT